MSTRKHSQGKEAHNNKSAGERKHARDAGEHSTLNPDAIKAAGQNQVKGKAGPMAMDHQVGQHQGQGRPPLMKK